jgi:hypothetical protein
MSREVRARVLRLPMRRPATAPPARNSGGCRLLHMPKPSDGGVRLRVLLQELRNVSRQLQLDCARLRAVSAAINRECDLLNATVSSVQGRLGSPTQRAVSATCPRVSLKVYEGSA